MLTAFEIRYVTVNCDVKLNWVRKIKCKRQWEISVAKYVLEAKWGAGGKTKNCGIETKKLKKIY